MRLISAGLGSWPEADGCSRSSSPSRMSLHSFTHSLQMYTEGPDTSRATSSWPRPQNEQRIGCGVAMRFFMAGMGPRTAAGKGYAAPFYRAAWLLASFLDDLVHQTVRLGLLGGHPVVPVGILDDLVHRLPGVLGEDRVQLVAGLEHLLGRDLHVRRLTRRAAEHLV